MHYFNSASKRDTIDDFPALGASNGQIWSAGLFLAREVDMFNDTALDDGRLSYISDMDMIVRPRRSDGMRYYPQGIVTCNTTLPTVNYSMDENATVSNLILTPMNDATASPFFQGLCNVNYVLELALRLAGANAKNNIQFAAQFGLIFDIAVLSMTAQVLEDKQAEMVYQKIDKSVTKMPSGTSVALIVLSLALTVLGEGLVAMAFILRTRDSVVDIQTKLNIGALVADKFEDSKCARSASWSEGLYPELMASRTTRVMAVVDEKSGQNVLRAVI